MCQASRIVVSIGLVLALLASGCKKVSKSGTQAGEKQTAARATETQTPRTEVVKVRIPEGVSLKRINVTKESSVSSDGHYLVTGKIEGKEVKGGEIALKLVLGASESTERTRAGIEELLGHCVFIAYFEQPVVVHGVFSPYQMEMVNDDKPEEVEGIVELSFSGASTLNESNFRYIEYLANVKRLFLNNTSITNSQLVHLGQLRRLRVLGLSQVPLTDEGLVHLKGLGHAKVISLKGTKVTDNAVEELRRSMPGTKIEK